MADLLRTRALASGHNSPKQLVVNSPQTRQWLAENLSPSQSKELISSWLFNARHNQLPPPGNWRTWYLHTGRGWGKNASQSNWLHDKAEEFPTLAGFVAGRTLSGVSKAIIYHPRSGLLVTQRPENPCEFKAHLRKVTWANGAFCDVHTSEEPDDARGPEYEVCSVGVWTDQWLLL